MPRNSQEFTGIPKIFLSNSKESSTPTPAKTAEPAVASTQLGWPPTSEHFLDYE